MPTRQRISSPPAGTRWGLTGGEVQAAQAALDDFSACLEAVQNGSKKQSLTSLPYYQGSAMHASVRPMRLWAP